MHAHVKERVKPIAVVSNAFVVGLYLLRSKMFTLCPSLCSKSRAWSFQTVRSIFHRTAYYDLCIIY